MNIMCPACKSQISFLASRCPYCTSGLPQTEFNYPDPMTHLLTGYLGWLIGAVITSIMGYYAHASTFNMIGCVLGGGFVGLMVGLMIGVTRK